jgi:DNA-binding CsgD family transcriptional regulator
MATTAKHGSLRPADGPAIDRASFGLLQELNQDLQGLSTYSQGSLVTRRDDRKPLLARTTGRFDPCEAPEVGNDTDGCIGERNRTHGARPRWSVSHADVFVAEGPAGHAAGGPHRHLRAVHEIEEMLWVGRQLEAREMCVAILRARPVPQPAGALEYAATKALVALNLATGHYVGALELLQSYLDGDHAGSRAVVTLPDLVEAGIRGGDRLVASRALRDLDVHVRTKPTPWGLGVLARSRALHTIGNESERLYLEAISHLSESGVVADLARAHLLFGEWLRRQRRRAEARSHLLRAHELFTAMGADSFAERAAVELVLTGGQARRRTVETQNDLTRQELHIAALAAAHATNREIGQRLFISARTVEYHLRHIFQKLQISSRRQLSAALARLSDGVGLNRLEQGEAG